MAEFTVAFGKQVFEGCSDSITLFSLPAEPRILWRARRSADKHFHKVRRGAHVAASTDGYDGHGKWHSTEYLTPDSSPPTLLIVALNRRIRGRVVASCCLHIIPNEAGPHLIVKARLSPHRLSSAGDDIAVFRGRGYIVDEVQLQELGIRFEGNDINTYMDAEELEDEFEIENISGSLTVTPEITTFGQDGDTEVVVTAPRGRRRVRVRK